MLLWPAGAALGIAAEWALYGWADPRHWVPDLLVGWTLIGCGLVGWSRRAKSRSGVLLAASGFAWFAANFTGTGVGAIDWLGADPRTSDLSLVMVSSESELEQIVLALDAGADEYIVKPFTADALAEKIALVSLTRTARA